MAMTEIITQVGKYRVRDGSRLLDVDATGDTTLSLEDWRGYDLRAAIAVFNEAPEVSGAELKFARKTLGLKQKEFARVLCVNEYTVSDWERGANPITGTMQRLVCEVLCHVKCEGYEILNQFLGDRPPAPADGVFEVPPIKEAACG
jgi:DNA-binding XRE family transcriptional regulator